MWNDFAHWLRTDGLVVVMIVSGAFLLVRLAGFLADRRVKSLLSAFARDQQGDPARLAHSQAAVQALRYGAVVVIAITAAVMCAALMHIPTTGLVPFATIVGLGFGLGAQRAVADIIAGVFIVSEHQYGVGDSITVGPFGATDGLLGTVEEITLRVTKLRTANGDLVTIANGEIRQVSNRSRDWSRVVVEVPVRRGPGLDATLAALNAAGEELANDALLGDLVLQAPQVDGVQDITTEHVMVRLTGRAVPARANELNRELRLRIAAALHEETP